MTGRTQALTFAAYGVLATLRFEDPRMREEAERQLPAGARLLEHDDGSDQLWVDRTGRVHSVDDVPSPTDVAEGSRGVVLARLAADLRHHVAVRSPALFVHAGAVAHAGRALLLPGRSYAGKSTLVAALLGVGADYLSDEFAVIDECGLVRPFAKPLSIREGGDGIGRYVKPQQLGARTVEEPTPVGLIAVTEFSATARWDPRAIGPAQAAMAILENTVTVRAEPDRALRRVRLLCDGVTAVEGARGEASVAAKDLLARLHAVREL